MQPLRAAICTGGSWLSPRHGGGRSPPKTSAGKSSTPRCQQPVGEFMGLRGGAGNLHQPKELLALWKGGHTAQDTCPWRAQAASPAPPETTSSSLSTIRICLQVPSTSRVFSNKQITSSSLRAPSAIPWDPAGGSVLPCTHQPVSAVWYAALWVLQFKKKKLKRSVFKALMALKTTRRVLFAAGEVNDLPLLQNQTGHHNK